MELLRQQADAAERSAKRDRDDVSFDVGLLLGCPRTAPRRAASARVSAKLQDAREPVPGNWQRAREMTPAERRSGGGGSSSSQYQRCSRHASSPERSSRNNDATTTATAR